MMVYYSFLLFINMYSPFLLKSGGEFGGGGSVTLVSGAGYQESLIKVHKIKN